MDGQQVKAWEARCIEEQPPACTAACPLHVDARAMLQKVAAGDFVGALGLYARIIPFPAIISHICDHPCETVCRRSEAGGAVRIGAIERAIVEEAYPTLRRNVLRNRKPKRIAVVGGGLAGLTAAHDLALKGHAVTVFEGNARLLDRLHSDYDAAILPPSAILADLGALTALGIEVQLRAHVSAAGGPSDLDTLIASHDAVLVAAGRGPQPGLAPLLQLTAEGRIAIDADSCATSHPKVFAAPVAAAGRAGTAAYSPVYSMLDGRRAAGSVDRYLQGASLTANRGDEGSGESCLYVEVERHAALGPVEPALPALGYSHGEAMAEAARCFPCECKACVRACAYLAHYGSYPKRYVREIWNNDGIVMGNRKANRMIDSCALCGLCETVCPHDLSMAEVVLDARRSMVRRGKMPPSHHDFALREMDFGRSAEAAFARPDPVTGQAAQLLFPGCQLTASAPLAVARLHAFLRETLPGGVGLMQDCCGAPAHWSGRESLAAEVAAGLDDIWRALGQPVMIVACSTCETMLRDFHPAMAVRSLWTVLAETGLPAGARAPAAPLAIHDPCTARHRPEVHRAVRAIAAQVGAEVRELSGAEKTSCCGYGGLAEFVNPEVADKMIDQRAAESPDDYLAYCAMCRDNFARRGKRSLHLLDLLFPAAGETDPAGRADPGFSRRRDNRRLFRRRMLREVWSEDMDVTGGQGTGGVKLLIDETVRVAMERRLILVEDVARTIAAAESSGQRLFDLANSMYVASHREGSLTTWVEYRVEADGYRVLKAYGHRMTVEAKPS